MSGLIHSDAPIMVNDTTDFDVSLMFDGAAEEASFILRKGGTLIDLSAQDAIDAAAAILQIGAPWKLR